MNQHQLPVVSQGSNYINQLRSGKALTQDSVEGCAVAVLETGLASQRPGARCLLKAPSWGGRIYATEDFWVESLPPMAALRWLSALERLA